MIGRIARERLNATACDATHDFPRREEELVPVSLPRCRLSLTRHRLPRSQRDHPRVARNNGRAGSAIPRDGLQMVRLASLPPAEISANMVISIY